MTSPSPETANNRTSDNKDATSQNDSHTVKPSEEKTSEPEKLLIQLTEEIPQQGKNPTTTTENNSRSEGSQMTAIKEPRDDVSINEKAAKALDSITDLAQVLVNATGHMLKIAETNQQSLSEFTSAMHQLNARLNEKDEEKSLSKSSTKSTDSSDRTGIAMPVPRLPDERPPVVPDIYRNTLFSNASTGKWKDSMLNVLQAIGPSSITHRNYVGFWTSRRITSYNRQIANNTARLYRLTSKTSVIATRYADTYVPCRNRIYT
ncbi:hypothetical protein BDP27DRAFT_1439665 [Rhodocollybia butyracea]|uniref:Uncharacterized protein n=1 Tax=Rhodocollybia butyracea TaxID=206335 RepID=A0A9P5TUY2_9AGAR|nr:hypothetical protein BDP27DRAFT_1439665 [Rhodocollybia butyracea]